jgi:GH25 family lysozyme M1 (1,4-beta-N-acetylmuramidase)
MFSKLALFAILASTGLALIHGVDNSALVPEATYAKAKSEGFTKVVIRGFEEACGVGGEVDPNFVTNYNNARKAGITNIDTYWFPCTGAAYKCKSFETQIAELGATFKAHDMKIGRIWIDFEVDTTACIHNWDYGHSGNLAEARKLIDAAKASGYVFGIYSSPGEWFDIFGSYGVIVDNLLPLWFATYDDDDSSLVLKTKFGGWKTAFGKQYTDHSASGLFDLDIFSH